MGNPSRAAPGIKYKCLCPDCVWISENAARGIRDGGKGVGSDAMPSYIGPLMR